MFRVLLVAVALVVAAVVPSQARACDGVVLNQLQSTCSVGVASVAVVPQAVAVRVSPFVVLDARTSLRARLAQRRAAIRATRRINRFNRINARSLGGGVSVRVFGF